MNQAQIQETIYTNYIVPLSIPITKDDFYKRMNLRDTWDHGRRVFKLATSRGVFGTPQFFINGVQVYNSDQWNKDEWLNLFQSLTPK
jgi:2-hydroxychromene-2-carboxylate isomerase